MIESNITRCPGCETSFKVTTEQMSAANGAVRCGACLQVFDATDYLLDDPEQNDPNDLETANGHEAVLEEDVFEEGAIESKVVEIQEPVILEELTDNAAEEIADESADEVTEPPHLSEPAGPDTDPDVEQDANRKEDDATDHNQFAEMAAEDQLEAKPTIVPPLELNEQKNDPSGEDLLDTTTELGRITDDPLTGFTGEINIDSTEPAEIVGVVQAKRAGVRIIWSLLAGIMFFLLCLQYGWYHREQLAGQETLRPYYEKVCLAVGCVLPEYNQLAAISTTGLVVRSHPVKANALIVDVVLRNKARFRQRFPRLELNFADINGKAIASRRFKSKEYLGGELSGMKYIPAETEVRLSLEIQDPGKAAVSYSMRVIAE